MEYNVKCTRKEDSFHFYYMDYFRVLEIIEDFYTSYKVFIKNLKTNKEYIIENDDDFENFEKLERKNSEVE